MCPKGRSIVAGMAQRISLVITTHNAYKSNKNNRRIGEKCLCALRSTGFNRLFSSKRNSYSWMYCNVWFEHVIGLAAHSVQLSDTYTSLSLACASRFMLSAIFVLYLEINLLTGSGRVCRTNHPRNYHLASTLNSLNTKTPACPSFWPRTSINRIHSIAIWQQTS